MNSPKVSKVSKNRVSELFRDQKFQLHRRTDRIFSILMLIQWAAAVAAAIWVSPQAWEGTEQSIHIHVLTAVFLGGAIASLPVYLAWRYPGQTRTRYVIAAAQLMFSSLLIHTTGGRIETHFHVFGSLAFLAIYRDWRVLLVATIVTVGDHVFRGWLWPQSIFGVLSASPWRWLEHAAWVVFEDIFLVISCFYSTREMKQVANRTANLEESNNKLETAIQREQDIRERYDLALGAAFDGVWDWDLRTGEVFFTDQNSVLLGEDPALYNLKREGYAWWEKRIHQEDLLKVKAAVEKHLASGELYDLTYRIRHQDGSWRWWRSRGEAQRDDAQNPLRFVGTNSDVTSLVKAHLELERKNNDLVEAKKIIEAVSLEDPLTKLPNRRYMEDVAEMLLKEAKSENREIAFLHIDLDEFKEINDRFGHSAGDFVLCQVAKSLRESIGESQFVARTGGDEFVAILTNLESRDGLFQFAEKLVDELNLPMLYEGQRCRVGASIGISFLDDSNCTPSQLLSNADIALYCAKRSGRNRVEAYSRQMGSEAEERRKLHNEILQGLENDEFTPHFQPQFCASTLRLAGVEALVRWNHPVRGVLTPPAFLDGVEEIGRVAEIDRLILRKSVAIMEEWERAGFYVPRLSVNVSSSRLNDSDLVETVESLNLQRNFLAFELLESIFLDEISPQVEENLARLNKLGVEIEIDDFGTGYASIVGMMNIRPKRLKIDRQLIMNIEEDESISELVRSVVLIADCMDIEVIAEGVETEKQIALLKEAGCKFLQGFKLGRPVSADALYASFCNVEDGKRGQGTMVLPTEQSTLLAISDSTDTQEQF